MQVILKKDVQNIGEAGDLVNVKDGYAENYLIKNGYAVKKTKENLLKLNQEQTKKAKEDAANKEEAKLLKEKLSKVTLEFKVKTGEGDRVFGSISIKQIKDELAKQGYKIEKSAIELTSNISSLGFHNVNINLYPEITAQIKVHVIK